MKSSIRIYLTILVLCLCSSAGLQAQSAAEAYQAGDYKTAIRIWEEERDTKGVSTELFYNLGNAYAKSGNQGGAVLNYEKALRIDPSDSRARNNLRYTDNLVQLANETFTDGKNMDPTPADPSFFENLGDKVSQLGSDTWAVWALVMFILCVGCCAAYFFSPKVSVRKVGFFGGGAMLLLCALCIVCSVVSKRHALSKDVCVLMAAESSLMLEPDEASKTVGTPLSAGTRFKVMSVKKGADGTQWTQVYLNAEYSGWIPSSDVAVVTVPQLGE